MSALLGFGPNPGARLSRRDASPCSEERLRSARGVAGRLGAVALVSGLGLGLWGAWIPVKAAAAQVLLRLAWARTADSGDRAAPWPWADTWAVARLRVPSRGIDQIVLEGASGPVLAFAPGRASGSRPQVVLGGHRDTHFAFLRHLAPGERLLLRLAGQKEQEYRVAWSAVVDHRDRHVLGDADRSVLVLVTCYPFEALTPGGPLRFVVWAEPVGAPAERIPGVRDGARRRPGLEGAAEAVAGWRRWLGKTKTARRWSPENKKSAPIRAEFREDPVQPRVVPAVVVP